MKRLLCSILILLSGASVAMAQELNCKVKVLADKIQNTDRSVFTTLERNITEFINNRKWTTDEFAGTERVDCTMLINLTGKEGDDIYTATINIQASRPVYGSSYSTSTVNYVDRSLRFRFSEYTPLQFDDNRVSGSDVLASNLTATLAFYSYLILALDYDSFSPSGGTNLLKRAQNIVSNAPDGDGISGWKAFENKFNRYWLIDQLLSPRFTSFRQLWYSYHREALDDMYEKPVESRQKVLAAVNMLNVLNRENPASAVVQFFFASKSDEMLRILAQSSKQERLVYAPILAQMDVPNAAKYNNIK